ncbi:MAG TPA: 16S rRNA (adenine(1518)-N(6)/adenine(1519)-N(6))-dimethyltransferase RsmA [Xenococcaceae cyanobacterium]
MNRPRKRFGQHWLKSDQVLEQIIAAAELKATDRILEIGAGTGILTRRLLSEVAAVVSVEIDRDLCKKLVNKFRDLDNFLLLQGDFISLDLDKLLQDFPRFKNPHKVVANIPYNITGLILKKILGSIAQPAINNYEFIVLLIQKEVGERLVAVPGTKAYGALSVKIQYLASCELICDVPAKAFYPPPKVDSVVVKLSPKIINQSVDNPKTLETLLKLGFANKRKMLRNNLKSLIDLDELNSLLEKLQINLQARAENLSLEDWINLSNYFSNKNSEV